MGDIMTPWEEILGSKDWTGLIEPELDSGLRQLIIRCADFCQATYDAFDSDAESPERGNTRHPNLASFFAAVQRLSDQSSGGLLYHALSFLYAASGTGDPSRNLFLHPGPAVHEPWDRQSNWMGYVAATSDEASRASGRREIYVVWRGTIMASEWTSNVVGALQASAGPLQNAGKIDNSVHVHKGWYNIYTSEDSKSTHATSSARTQVRSAVRGLVEKHSGENISVVVTGHSLGGALATLCAFDLVENADVSADVHVAAVVFGCPQVGNSAFKRRVESHPNLNILHVRNSGDVVPQLPDSALPFYVPIVTVDLEIQHPGNWYDVANNHSLIVTLDALRGKFNNGLALHTVGSTIS